MATLGIKLAGENRAVANEAEPGLYERDFFQWTQVQTTLLREGRWTELDVMNLMDEVETLGRSVRREIESRLSILVVHLLKHRFQPERRSRSWRSTIAEQRNQIRRELRESPSLKTYPAAVLEEDYSVIRLKAAGETNLSEEVFPETCPFTIAEILNPDFYPESESEGAPCSPETLIRD